jgi:cytosine/adenosine deaminase-related metal-dependent hydrolase
VTPGVLVVDGCAVVTMDRDRTEHDPGYVVVDNGVIADVGAGPAPADQRWVGADRVDGSGCLLTPGLVNTHHHLYQWATRGRAVDEGLFGWLTVSDLGWSRRCGCRSGGDCGLGLAGSDRLHDDD